MYELSKLIEYLLSPLTMAMGLWLISALCLALRRRTAALALAILAFGGLWIGSTPGLARMLNAELESRYPALPTSLTPTADAIVILGGSVAGRHPPHRPSLALSSASSRVWYAAELFRGGKGKWVVVAAGGTPESAAQQSESQAIAEMLVELGVPRTAIRLETESLNTRENAANIKPILIQLAARRVLLVTSGQHMPRAVKTFEKVWANSGLTLVPAPTDVTAPRNQNPVFSWIPSPNALLGVTKALKEYAGMIVLAIIW
jgi:uncharacterized SAM-binding protein YcdF (DUF218 family)